MLQQKCVSDYKYEELEKRDNLLLSKTSNAIKDISETEPVYIKVKLHIKDDNEGRFEIIKLTENKHLRLGQSTRKNSNFNSLLINLQFKNGYSIITSSIKCT